MTPLTTDYRSSKAPGALFAIILTVGVNAGLFAVLGWVNRRSPALNPEDKRPIARALNLQKLPPPRKQKPVDSKPAKRPVKRIAQQQTARQTIRRQRPSLVRPPAIPQIVNVNLTLPDVAFAPSLATRLDTPFTGDLSTSPGPAQATIANESEVDSPPQPTYSPSPRYPFSARKMGYTGSVIIALIITKAGKAEDLRIKTSSGHHALDNSALRTVRTWRFRPAEDQGRTVDVRGTVQINFQLDNQ